MAYAEDAAPPSIEINKTQESGRGAISWTTTDEFTRSSLTDFSFTFSLSAFPESGADAFYRTKEDNSGLGLMVKGDGTITFVHGDNAAIAYEGADIPSVTAATNTTYTMTILEGKAYLWEGDSLPTEQPAQYLDLTQYLTRYPDATYTLTSGTAYLFSNSATTKVTLGTLTDLTGVTTAAYFSTGGSDTSVEDFWGNALRGSGPLPTESMIAANRVTNYNASGSLFGAGHVDDTANPTTTCIEISGTGATGLMVFGGIDSSVDAEARDLTGVNSWILLSGGDLDLIVGGNHDAVAGNAAAFTGDSQVRVTGGTVDNIVGGNFGDANGSAFTGNSYITVEGINTHIGITMGGSIGTGGGDGKGGAVIGATYISILGHQESTGTDALNGVPSLDAIVGGNADLSPDGVSNDMVFGASGGNHSTNITVDFSAEDHTAGEEFKKKVIGGDWVGKGSTMTHYGSTNISLSNVGQATFTGGIVGGGWLTDDCGTDATFYMLEGNPNDTVAGGNYTRHLVGGSRVGGGGSSIIGETGSAVAGTVATNVTINGGNFNETVVGGSYFETSGSSTINGDIHFNISGGSFNKSIVAGDEVFAGTAYSTINGSTYLNITGATIVPATEINESEVVIVGGSHIAASYDSSNLATASAVITGTTNITVNMADPNRLVDAHIIGGHYVFRYAVYEEGSNHKLSIGGTNVTLTSGVFGADADGDGFYNTHILGGSYYDADAGHGNRYLSSVTVGDITGTVNGATVNSQIYGASDVNMNAPSCALEHGKVLIDLQSGLVRDVFAAGASEAPQTTVNIAGTHVRVSSEIEFGQLGSNAKSTVRNAVFSGAGYGMNGNSYSLLGYEPNVGFESGWEKIIVTEGARLLEFGTADTVYGNLGTADFHYFDEVKVAGNSVAVMNSNQKIWWFNHEAVTVSGGGTLRLSANQDVTVAYSFTGAAGAKSFNISFKDKSTLHFDNTDTTRLFTFAGDGTFTANAGASVLLGQTTAARAEATSRPDLYAGGDAATGKADELVINVGSITLGDGTDSRTDTSIVAENGGSIDMQGYVTNQGTTTLTVAAGAQISYDTLDLAAGQFSVTGEGTLVMGDTVFHMATGTEPIQEGSRHDATVMIDANGLMSINLRESDTAFTLDLTNVVLDDSTQNFTINLMIGLTDVDFSSLSMVDDSSSAAGLQQMVDRLNASGAEYVLASGQSVKGSFALMDNNDTLVWMSGDSVPEPSTTALSLLALVALAARRRR